MATDDATQGSLFGEVSPKKLTPGSAEYQKERKIQRQNDGLCVSCVNPSEGGISFCPTCKEKHRARYRKKKESRVCINCKNPSVPGRVRCQEHLDRFVQFAKDRKDQGVCAQCINPARPGKTLCQACCKAMAASVKEKNSKAKEAGLCYVCKKTWNVNGLSCLSCRSRRRANSINLKIEVMKAYGGPVCRCCGETRIEFLTIEHVNRDGADHRREMKAKSGGFYLKLRRLKFPKDRDMVVNCMNCNMARGLYGICPHEKERGLASPVAGFYESGCMRGDGEGL